MIEMPDFLEELVNEGIRVTIEKSDRFGIHFDLHLDAKSHMYLFKSDGEWRVDMRYDEQHIVEDISDLCHYAKRGMHGRDFISYDWADLLRKKGYL